MAETDKEAEARRWMSALPREQFDMLLILTNAATERGRREGLRQARDTVNALEEQYDDTWLAGNQEAVAAIERLA